MGHAVYYLLGTDPCGVVGIGRGLTTGGKARKLSAVLPGEARIGLGAVGITDGVATCGCAGDSAA